MKTSQSALDKIADFEGVRLKAYLDPIGIPTIGVGHTAGVQMGQTITREQAVKFFAEDIASSENAVTKTGLTLNQNQFDALVSFAYNCGAGNLSKLVKGRTLQQIADAIPLYNKAAGKVLAGLTRRRKWERELFLKEATTLKNNTDLAREVLDGKWGSGAERKRRLTEAGYSYSAVQKEINRLLRG